MDNINVFNYSKLKLMNEGPSKLVSWLTIIISLLILFLIFSIFFKYNIYSSHVGYIEISGNYNLKVIVDDKAFPIKNNYKLFIDNKNYKYKVVNIVKQVGYYELLINCNLDSYLLINNNIVTVRFQKEKTTIFKELEKKITKGLI